MSLSLEETLADARMLMPTWVVWSHILIYLALAVAIPCMTSTLSLICSSLFIRKPADDTWVQRARSRYPRRAVASDNVLIMTALLAIGTLLLGWPFSPISRGLLCVGATIVAFLTTSWIAYRAERHIHPPEVSATYWWQSEVVLLLCYRPQLLFVLLLFCLLPDRFDVSTAIKIGVALVPYLFLMLGGGLHVARAVGLAKPASERLVAIVQRAAEAMSVEPPPTYELRWLSANAMAFPAIGRLAFSDRAVRDLTDEELQAICTHELGHLSENRFVVAGRLAGSLILFPVGCLRPIVGTYGLIAVLLGLPVVLVTVILIGRLARRMEQRADAMAHDFEADAGVYARALERVYELNLMPVVMSGQREVHPHLYDRLVAAGVTPAYPRPARPQRFPRFVGLITTMLVSIVMLSAWRLTPQFVLQATAAESWLQFAAGFGSDRQTSARILAGLGWYPYERGDYPTSAVFLRAATACRTGSWEYPSRLAITLAALGDKLQGEQALREAEGLYRRHVSQLRQTTSLPPPGTDNTEFPYREPPIIYQARLMLDQARLDAE